MFFLPCGQGQSLADPGDISAVMGYLPHPGYKGVPQGLNIPIGSQSKPLREPNLAPSPNPSGNQIGGDVSPVEATAPRNIASSSSSSESL